MKLAIISNYYPDGRPLSEHALYMVEGLAAARPDHEITILASNPGPRDHPRPWTYGSPLLAHQICRAVKELAPDCVLVNSSFSSWGDGNISNFLSFWAIRQLAKMTRTVVLVHHLPQTLDVAHTGYKVNWLQWAGIEVACRLLARAQVVAFTQDCNVDFFRKKYRHKGVVRVELGGAGSCTNPPCDPNLPFPTVLAFGFWGPSKDLEMLLHCLNTDQSMHVVVAGRSHPRFPGHLERLEHLWRDHPRVKFLGYIPEDGIAEVFRNCHALVMPYLAQPGASLVLRLACQHGRAILATPLPGLIEEAKRHNLPIRFFRNELELLDKIGALRIEDMIAEGQRTFEVGCRLDMQTLAEEYWRILEPTEATKVL